jgi:hypothetical protein
MAAAPKEKRMYYSRNIMRAGRKLLRKLLPDAQRIIDAAKLEGKAPPLQAASQMGDASLPYLHKDSMDAVCVHPGEKGGWIARLVFKDVPLGLADMAGTLVADPHATRDQAIAFATGMIAICLGRDPPSVHAEPDAVFEFYDASIMVRRMNIENFKECDVSESWVEATWKDLVESNERHVEDGKIQHKIKAMSHDEQTDLQRLALLSVCQKLNRWPVREAGAPAQTTIH